MASAATMKSSLEQEEDVLRVLAAVLSEANGTLRSDPEAASRHIERALRLVHEGIGQSCPPAPGGEGAKGGLAPWQAARVERHISQRVASRFEAAEAAALVGLSESHFKRAFKTSFGMAPHAYITAKRIAEAKRLLERTEMALAEVASACGFGDQAHLCHVFRRVAGSTPAAWRRLAASDVTGSSPHEKATSSRAYLRSAS